MWVLPALFSATFLGVYDIFKKLSLNDNAVIPVLFFSALAGTICFMFPIVLSPAMPEAMANLGLYVPQTGLHEHLMIFLKAVIVVGSWIFSFFALKHLPISIVTPVRATGPLWTLLGALVIYAERLNSWQWIGISLTLFFFYLFSLAGKKEGIHFKKNKWVLFIVAGTLLGAVSGLYDKFLIRELDRLQVQAWFSVYQSVVLFPVLMILWYPKRKTFSPFKWRWSIPLIGVSLIVADYAYFYALSDHDSMISVISAIRRGSVFISFSSGALLFGEKNIKQKAVLLVGILTGIFFLYFGSH